MTYFSLLFEDSSILIYTIIFFLASFFAFKSQKTYSNGRIDFHLPWFVFCFLLLWVFFAFNDVGSDLPQYRYLFENSKSGETNYETGLVEIGYIYLNYFVHFFTHNPVYGVAIIRTIQLLIIFASFYLLRKDINLGFTVTAYVALYYFASFNILRSSLAGAICILNIALILREKNLFCIPLMVLAYTLHRSSALFLLPIASYYLLYKSPFRKIGNVGKIVYVLVCIAVLSYGTVYIQRFIDSGFGAGRFDGYLEEEQTVGVMFLFIYFPLFWALYKSRVIVTLRQTKLYDLAFVFLVFECLIAMLAYKVGILTRADIYFSMPLLIYIPAFLSFRGHMGGTESGGMHQWRLFFYIYLCLRFIITISGIFKVSMIDHFHFISL